MTQANQIPAFRLSLAVLCVDCETVSAAVHNCPGCGSIALMSLAKVVKSSPVRADYTEEEIIFSKEMESLINSADRVCSDMETWADYEQRVWTLLEGQA